jgi:hypothetical protein
VRSGLQVFGYRLTENSDQTFRVVIIDDNLRVEVVPDVLEHHLCPQAMLDDPLRLTLLDPGHPLAQRLIDVVKTSVFHDSGERSGHTAHTITREVIQTTALLHVLARSVAGTTPLSIVEERIPVAFPIYSPGLDVLTTAQVEALLRARPETCHKSDAEVSEDLIEALRRPDLKDLL